MPARPSLRLVVVVAVAVVAYLVAHAIVGRSRSELQRVTGAVVAAHPGAACERVGLLEVAGGRSVVYGCEWQRPASTVLSPLAPVRRCEVWVAGGLVDVTAAARRARLAC